MHAGRHYPLKHVLLWTRRETFAFAVIATVPTIFYSAGWHWLTIPWLPIALIGTAVAFITGFKNNASYGRLWEARQIWGGIVNTSRSFTIMACDYLLQEPGDADPSLDLRAVRDGLVARHIAWLTALRFQLREPRAWENIGLIHNAEYRRHYQIPERDSDYLGIELGKLLTPTDCAAILGTKNPAAQLLAQQSHALRALRERGLLSDYRHVALTEALVELYEHQGKCERIKNFPYPRQFATLNLLFVWLFIILVPLGLLQEFQKLGDEFVWLTIPAGVVVAWVFHTMDKIGESSENPFEGGPNDVPITAIARAIEVDLREMLGQKDIPPLLQPRGEILM
ncbi:bestrophin family protein [Nannocystis bainbridge]|uniref:Bestrophin family ion channel n=1 Tax=Nannocystis bainbridge TaxID=2995303 RepID=A0ABT5DWX4_9BACT|nr:bestrophin family ion channel [Nannocystis bainbridge]MDC0717228.1 bestrophin family ion channel [Nannocystis bainbridge]